MEIVELWVSTGFTCVCLYCDMPVRVTAALVAVQHCMDCIRIGVFLPWCCSSISGNKSAGFLSRIFVLQCLIYHLYWCLFEKEKRRQLHGVLLTWKPTHSQAKSFFILVCVCVGGGGVSLLVVFKQKLRLCLNVWWKINWQQWSGGLHGLVWKGND